LAWSNFGPFAIAGEELPVMFGKGGMKKFFKSQTLSPSVSSNNITLDEACGSIGNGNSVCVTTIMDNGSVLQEIVDAEVNEKQTRADVEQRRQVRFRRDDASHPYPPAPVQSAPTPANTPRSTFIPSTSVCRTMKNSSMVSTAGKLHCQSRWIQHLAQRNKVSIRLLWNFERKLVF
jgi:hypothetical protein